MKRAKYKYKLNIRKSMFIIQFDLSTHILLALQ